MYVLGTRSRVYVCVIDYDYPHIVNHSLLDAIENRTLFILSCLVVRAVEAVGAGNVYLMHIFVFTNALFSLLCNYIFWIFRWLNLNSCI